MSAPLRDEAAPGLSLVDLLLEEQADLSAVERFALRELEGGARPPTYETLLPTGRPGAREQYAFRVDLDACTGCKACVTACHSMNGLDDGETWRRVGLLVGVDEGEPVQQTVTGACHHCEDPGCLSGCPVRAYEKDEVTGIVRHLDDQCIGCKYCTLTCPYDVPQYNERLGIVRKCDMCTGRLAAGEAPACVQGCPNGAIAIEVVPVRGEGAPYELLPSPARELAPSVTTRPTTRYVQARTRAPGAAPPRLRASDREVATPNHAHWPLAVLLVCVQLSVGLVGVDTAARVLSVQGGPTAGWLGVHGGPTEGWLGVHGGPTEGWLALAWIAAVMGQGAAFLHVGRPLYAFRVVLGLRTSWMSREVVALGAYVALLSLHLGVAEIGLRLAPDVVASFPLGAAATALAAFAAGVFGIFTSVMLYAVTGRPLWTRRRTALRFASTAFILGTAGGAAVGVVAGAPFGLAVSLVAAAALAGACKLAVERRVRSADRGSAIAALVRSATLESAALAGRVRARGLLLLAGLSGLLCAALFSAGGAHPVVASACALAGGLAVFAGELCERNLFFVTEASRGMPGA